MDEWTVELLPRRGCLEAPPAPKRLTAAWSDGKCTPLRDGLRMDGEWEHHRVRQEGQTREPRRPRALPLDPHPFMCLIDVLFSWSTLRTGWRTCMASGWFTETLKEYAFSSNYVSTLTSHPSEGEHPN